MKSMKKPANIERKAIAGFAGAPGSASPCNCWHTKDDGLRKMGYKISDACSMLELDKETLSLKGQYGLPLQRTDGKPMRRDDARMITMSHCPFCGAKL